MKNATHCFHSSALTLQACVTSISHFLPPWGADQPVSGWDFKLPCVSWDMQGRGRGVLLMTSAGELRLSKKLNFKEPNEKIERRQKQAGVTCQSREQSEGAECEGLGLNWSRTPSNAVKGIPEWSSPLTVSSAQSNTQTHLLKLAWLYL